MISTRHNQPVLLGVAARQALTDIRKRMKARRAPRWNLHRHRSQAYAKIEAYRQYFNALRSSQRPKSTWQT